MARKRKRKAAKKRKSSKLKCSRIKYGATTRVMCRKNGKFVKSKR